MSKFSIVKHPSDEYLYAICESKSGNPIAYLNFNSQEFVCFDDIKQIQIESFYATMPTALAAFKRIQQKSYLSEPEEIDASEMKIKLVEPEKKSIFNMGFVFFLFVVGFIFVVGTGLVTIFKTLVNLL